MFFIVTLRILLFTKYVSMFVLCNVYLLSRLGIYLNIGSHDS